MSVAVAQALEEVRKQREEFQEQAANLTAIVEEKEQSLQGKNEVILQKEQEILQLKKGNVEGHAGPHIPAPGCRGNTQW